jgi:hypothetical protein
MNTNAFQAGKFDPQVYRTCNGRYAPKLRNAQQLLQWRQKLHD